MLLGINNFFEDFSRKAKIAITLIRLIPRIIFCLDMAINLSLIIYYIVSIFLESGILWMNILLSLFTFFYVCYALYSEIQGDKILKKSRKKTRKYLARTRRILMVANVFYSVALAFTSVRIGLVIWIIFNLFFVFASLALNIVATVIKKRERKAKPDFKEAVAHFLHIGKTE